MQQNESITSTDASVGKETEQKTNENKDQPQSAQNNQTANEVKNDVKNVNIVFSGAIHSNSRSAKLMEYCASDISSKSFHSSSERLFFNDKK